MRNVVALFVALAPAAVLACHPELAKRSAVNAARGLPERKTEAQAAAILDPKEECSYYNYEPVNAILDSYPAIWKTAHMNASGLQPDAQQLFENISATIPDIPPRGGRYGDFQGITYNYTADPDCWWSASHCMTPKPSTGLKPDLTHCEEPNVWVFSHDDGPNCSHNAFYDYMAERKQKATLFYIGSNVLDWPLEAQRGLADGHEICAHTWSHPYMTGLTNEEVFAELYFAKKAIKEVLGITVRCWRPPYGDVDNRVRFIAEKLDLRTTMWKEDTDDWQWVQVGKPQIRANYRKIFADQAAGKFDTLGPIVLSHELNNGTMSLIDEFLPQMQEQFTGGVMPLAVCMNNSRPYIEQEDYVYPNFKQWRNGTLSVSLASPTAKSVKSIHLKPTATSAVATLSASSGATKSRASAGKPSATAVSEHTSDAGATGPKAVGFGLTASALALAGILLVR